MIKSSAALFIALLVCTATSFGHQADVSSAQVALDERLGDFIPEDAVFYDEEGTKVPLRRFINKPTIIAPVYFHCMHTCPLLLTGLAQALGKMELAAPGKDFQVIALSFDEKDTPRTAREKKKNYLPAVGKPFPADAWKFLVGDRQNIRRFTDASGYTIQRDGEDFSHPIALVIAAPGGRIVRYLPGVSFLPFDLAMAVTEAAEGKVSSPTRRVLQYCFSYDPQKNTYVFNILKVTGSIIIAGLGVFAAVLFAAGRKKRGTHP